MAGSIRVFCSHASADKPVLASFFEQLKEDVEVWVDREAIEQGDDFVAAIEAGLSGCSAGILFLSPQFERSKWAGKEWTALYKRHVDTGLPLYVVMVESVEPPALLACLQRSPSNDPKGLAAAIRDETPLPTRTYAGADGVRDLIIGLSWADGGVAVSLGADRVITALGPALTAALDTYRAGRDGALQRNEAPGRVGQARVALGRALGAVVYAGAIGERVAQDLASADASPLRLRFVSDHADLLSLPFAAALLPDGTAPALAPEVRLIQGPLLVEPSPRQTLGGPLRVLVAVGAPEDGPEVQLDFEREYHTVLDALDVAGAGVNATLLEVGHPEHIARMMAAAPFHAVHISCHGSANRLQLEDADGNTCWTNANALLKAFARQERYPPLVVLSACHSGGADPETGSFALALVQRGVPHVLAMQGPVTDDYAAQLAGRFYRALVTHRRPDTALAIARQELEDERRALPEPPPAEYATPALFCAGRATELFDPEAPAIVVPPRPPLPVVGVPLLGPDDLIGRRGAQREVLEILRTQTDVAGVVITGIGGGGKSALAGRLMARLRDSSWTVLAHVGVLSVGELCASLAPQVKDADLRHQLGPEVDDPTREAGLKTLLARRRQILVLDNFETNLSVGGVDWHPGVQSLLGDLIGAAETRLLITCRHPLPGQDALFERYPLQPLTRAETRRLIRRLEGLSPAARNVCHRLGGHPRTLENLHGLLRKGRGRLKAVTRKLADLVARTPGAGPNNTLEIAVANALAIGAQDILLPELLDLAGDATAVLYQLAVFEEPADLPLLAAALNCPVETLAGPLERLVDLSLVTPVKQVPWVHRWTAEALLKDRDQAPLHKRAGDALMTRARQTRQLEPHVRAMRQYLGGDWFDGAATAAWPIVRFLRTHGQSTTWLAVATEMRSALPHTHDHYTRFLKEEGDAKFRALPAGRAARAACDCYEQARDIERARLEVAPNRTDYQRDLSVSLNKLGDLYRALGDGTRAHDAYQQSLDIAQALAAREPDRTDYQRDLSVSLNKLGDLYRALGDGTRAHDAYQQSLDIAQALAAREPDRTDYQRDLSVSLNKLGDLYRALGDGTRAHDAYQQSLDIRQALAAREPDRTDYQRDLSVSLNKLGDLYRALGDGTRAHDAYQQSHAILEALAAREPDRTDYQRDLSVSLERLGDLYRALGDGTRAHDAYQQSLDIAQALAAREPDRTDYQRDLSVSLERLGDLYRALGDGTRAHDAYQQSLDIRQALAAREPDRTDYQRDLSVSLNNLGDLYRALGDGTRAHDAYQQSLDIRQALAAREPDRTDYQRDLSVSLNKLGDLYRALGDGTRAHDAYQQSHAILEALAAREPDRTDYQRDLSVSLNNLGDLYRALGDGTRAHDAYQQSLDIAQALAAREPDRTDYQRDLSVSLNKLGDLYRALGDGTRAHDAYQQSLDIRQALAAREPDRTDYQRDLSVSLNKLGDLYRALGDGTRAHDAYQQSLDIRQALAAREPDRTDYQRDLSVSCLNLASLHREAGESEAARPYFERDLAIARALSAAEPTRADLAADLAISLLQSPGWAPENAAAAVVEAHGILTALSAEGRLMPDQEHLLEAASGMLTKLGG